MLIAGLWHGADWHFIAFGGFHGVLQVLWLVVPGAKVLSSSAGFLPRIASRMLTFVLVCVAWVLFRSDTMSDAARVLASAAGANGPGAEVPSGVVSWLAVHAVPFVLLIALVRNEKEEADLARRSKAMLAISYFLMIILLASSEAGRAQFIYFQF
jgi:D-alanyl-lipoteichoic acid acyltransferase DltB (MBOAT superfamily)